YLTEDDARVELSSRIRARMIQLFGWPDCETSLTPGIAELLDRPEFPQDLGSILYMGVRTFYEEDYLRSLQPDLTQTYVRLSSSPLSIADFFGFDEEESQLLRMIQPELPIAALLAAGRKVERGLLLGLLLLLRLGNFCEVSKRPFTRQVNPRQPTPRERRSPLDRPETPGPADRSVAQRAPLPPPEDRPVATRAPTAPEARRQPTWPDDRSGALRAPVAPEDKSVAKRAPTWPDEKSVAQRAPLPPEDRSVAQRASMAPEDKSVSRRAPTSPGHTRPSPPSLSASAAPASLADPPPPRPGAQSTVDATQEALLEAAARTARLRRSLPARRQSKNADAQAPAAEGGSVAARAPEAPKTEAQAEYAKAHLKELIARRKQTATAAQAPTPQRDAARELREARNLLQAQQYARAEKLLAGLVELEPANEAYKTYHLWSRWRAQPEAAETISNELRDNAKKLIGNAEHAAFAVYVLGHVYLHEKRDDLAEKFFKRAHAADKGNKDAERHLLILERRKQAAAEGSNANRKLFGIQLPNSKPKP
ncbi:MAG TPA: hypothetical protein VFN67_12945, partial [Polyangiales bacterium]|nr:hypothetical protein [Polyangiales bacterium]